MVVFVPVCLFHGENLSFALFKGAPQNAFLRVNVVLFAVVEVHHQLQLLDSPPEFSVDLELVIQHLQIAATFFVFLVLAGVSEEAGSTEKPLHAFRVNEGVGEFIQNALHQAFVVVRNPGNPHLRSAQANQHRHLDQRTTLNHSSCNEPAHGKADQNDFLVRINVLKEIFAGIFDEELNGREDGGDFVPVIDTMDLVILKFSQPVPEVVDSQTVIITAWEKEDLFPALIDWATQAVFSEGRRVEEGEGIGLEPVPSI